MYEEEVNSIGAIASKLQQEQDEGPSSTSTDTVPLRSLIHQSNFASRIRSVDAATGRPVERLAPSADTEEAVAFSMQMPTGNLRIR